MKILVVVLLVVWALVAVLGAVIEGLLWLVLVGLVLFVATAAYGWFTLRGLTQRTDRT